MINNFNADIILSQMIDDMPGLNISCVNTTSIDKEKQNELKTENEETRNKNIQNEEIQNKKSQNKKCQNKESQDEKSQDEKSQDKEVQNEDMKPDPHELKQKFFFVEKAYLPNIKLNSDFSLHNFLKEFVQEVDLEIENISPGVNFTLFQKQVSKEIMKYKIKELNAEGFPEYHFLEEGYKTPNFDFVRISKSGEANNRNEISLAC